MCLHAQLLGRVQLFATPWTEDHQASLSMGFSRQEYWSRWPFPPPGDLNAHLNAHLHLLRWQEGSLPLCYLGSLFKHKTWYHKTPTESTGKIFSDINHTTVFVRQSPRPIDIKTKINKCSLIKLISFCTPKKTIKKNENATYELGENICKWCNWQWLSF